jgi:hypothetical protein
MASSSASRLGWCVLLHGRATECAAILGLLAGARQGASGALVLRAEAGMGKTAMMTYAISEASGIQVIAATAAPGEYGLPFACLHRLLAGWTEHAQEIPEVQRDALLGALAPGPQLRPEDRFVVHVAVLSILGVIADAGPCPGRECGHPV